MRKQEEFKNKEIYYKKSNLLRLRDYVVAPNGCWEWSGNLSKAGYGRVQSVEGTVEYTHRLSWKVYKGTIPPGIFVCHKCDNPKCINPEHLFLGTCADNIEDACRKGRMKIPKESHMSNENHQVSKLTDDQVKFIRNNPQISGRNLSRMFGLTESCISMARTGKTFKDLK